MLGLSPRLVEQPPLRRRPARWPPGRFGLGRFRIKVGEDLLDDVGIFDARDDPHRPAAGRTGLDVDPENPLEALRPGRLDLSFDTKDNTMLPSKGRDLTFRVERFDDAFGGDFYYWMTTWKLRTFHRLSDKFVLGARLDLQASDGDVPFFAQPFVSMRGIQALRYQNERAGAVELELRYDLASRWALLAFAGNGFTDGDIRGLESTSDIQAWGLGFRYNLFQAQDVWVGIDIADGEEESAWYIQVGHAW